MYHGVDLRTCTSYCTDVTHIVLTSSTMRKRARLYLRIAPSQASLLQAAAERLDMSVSEFVRRAADAAAVDTLKRGTIPGAESDRTEP